MSAKEFYFKNDPPHLPYLPPELWTQIIRHATWVPGGYDPELTELALSVNANTMNKERLEAWKKALVTRRALVRVSKAWYTLASPFLYEYILLGKGKAVSSLLCGMRRAQQGAESEDSTRPIGWWTKRLDVNLRNSTSDPRADMDALAGVMKYLPNLRVLTFSITGNLYKKRIPPNVLGSVSCRETLKFVHFYTYCLPSAENWTVFLEQHPYLESANLNNHIFSARSHGRLSCLRTIHINHDTTYLHRIPAGDFSWHTSFPAVRAATYDLEFSMDDEQAEQFFTAFGPKLTTIQLSQLRLDPEDPWNDTEIEANLEETLHWMRSECHALEHINLLFRSWHIFTLFKDADIFPSKVSTLTIRILQGQVSKEMTAQLFQRIFSSMKNRNANLKTIQFSNRMNVRGLRAHPRALTEGLRRMSDIGLVIKDNEGCIME
ncbi:hypothetical protein BJ912DRAFT_647118 [Pholiota molesta]|nr:hypothetical protein BJ912DRAFT_647118 [Pholiota molesta]